MAPINQVILGGDPLLGSSINLEDQIKLLEKYKQNLEIAQQMKSSNNTNPAQKLLWDEIDNELRVLTDEQKGKMFENEEYNNIYSQLQQLVNNEILNLVKHRIESLPQGKALLEEQYKLVKKLKQNIIDQTQYEMTQFIRFKEFSKANPNTTFEEFIKTNI